MPLGHQQCAAIGQNSPLSFLKANPQPPQGLNITLGSQRFHVGSDSDDLYRCSHIDFVIAEHRDPICTAVVTYGMKDSRPNAVHMAPGTRLVKPEAGDQLEVERYPYRSLVVACFICIARCTHPDIPKPLFAFVTGLLLQVKSCFTSS